MTCCYGVRAYLTVANCAVFRLMLRYAREMAEYKAGKAGAGAEDEGEEGSERE